MAAQPDDGGLRNAYFELLIRLASRYSGLSTVVLPELGAPLYFRGGTPDIHALAKVFREPSPPLQLRATPQRILLIGAHAGYVAVDLARRHPRASLLCVEPLADNFRLLTLNTQAYRRIRLAQTALWHGSTRVAASYRLQSDWLVRLTDEALDADRTITTMAPGELIARAGWSHVDMVMCDATGAEREIFADALAPWLHHLDVALVRLHEQLAPGAGMHVANCFPQTAFGHRTVAGMELYERLTPLTALPPLPPELPLVSAEPALVGFSLDRVAQHGWAFFIFEGGSCQLHPNGVGTAPPRLTVPLQLDGHRRLISGVLHAGQPPSAAVVLRARLERADGTLLGEASATVAPRETARLVVELPEPASGPARAVLETEMAEGAPDNRAAWARFIDPRVV
jgi:FkbM family methyltransferase